MESRRAPTRLPERASWRGVESERGANASLRTDKRDRSKFCLLPSILPVIGDGTLLGLVSIGDLVKSIISDREFVIEQLEHYIRG